MPQDLLDSEVRNRMIMVLILGSLILFAGSVYLTKDFAILYGVGVGASIQSASTNTILNQTIVPIATNLSFFHIAIAISYLLCIISLILCGSALVLFMKRGENSAPTVKTYGLVHAASMFLYALVVILLLSSFYQYMKQDYLLLVYFGIIICMASDIYLQYDARLGPRAQKIKSSISVDPSTPFSNIVNIQEEIFSKMAGHMKVVDKHFNSSSMINFHRLIAGSTGNVKRITILTSKEMLDGDFPNSVNDLRNELSQTGIEFEVRVLDQKDSAEQHERFIADDKIAYKVPPFNIINKKSEHINRIKLSEANARFYYLYGRASKIDNYLVRKGHDEQSGK